jgi:hypothetical protein
MAMLFTVFLVLVAVVWLVAAARPEPVKVRRNLTPQEIAALRRQERDDR